MSLCSASLAVFIKFYHHLQILLQLSNLRNHLERPAILFLLTLSLATYLVSSHFDHFNLK